MNTTLEYIKKEIETFVERRDRWDDHNKTRREKPARTVVDYYVRDGVKIPRPKLDTGERGQ